MKTNKKKKKIKPKKKKKIIVMTASEQIVGFSISIPPTNTQYLVGAGSSPNENEYNFTAPKSGTIDKLTVNVLQNALDSLVLTVRIANGINPFNDTTQTITIPASATGSFSPVISPVSFNTGDRISLQAVSGTGTGPAILSAGFIIS